MARQRCCDQDPVIVTRAQLVDWAARITRLSYDEDAQDSMLQLAQEIKGMETKTVAAKAVVTP